MNMLQELIRECDRDGLKEVWLWAKERSDQLVRAEASKWFVGERVRFFARGQHWAGIIVKLNPKTAYINCPDGKWTVHYGQFDAAADNVKPEFAALNDLL